MTTQTPWYRTGTVAVTAGSKSVTGTGSAWQSQVLAGDLFGLTDANGNLTTALAEVESVSSDTALTLKAQWPGSTLSGQKYAIIRNFTGSLPADLAARLSKLIAQYQISVDELTELLTSSGTVTLTTLTGETVSVQGLAGITTRLTAAESALANKVGIGAYGIGGAAAAIPSGNLDDNTTPSGIYYVVAHNSGTPPAGDSYGHLIVSREGGGTTVRQLYLDNTTDAMWTRAWVVSSWSAWQQLAFTESPSFSGTPTAPTPAVADYSTKLATTGFVYDLLRAHGIGTEDMQDYIGDLNNLYTGGFWIASGANTPTVGAYLVLVMSNASNYAVQYATAQGPGDLITFIRTSSAGVWTSWRRLACTDNPTFTGTATFEKLAAQTRIERQDGASEGGDIRLEKPVASSLAGDVVLDVLGDSVRLFESGGSARGVFVNLTQMSAEAAARLLTSLDLANLAPITDPVFTTAVTVATPEGLRLKSGADAGGYGVLTRNDGSNFYLLLTNQNNADGGWNSFRPFTIGLATGDSTFGSGESTITTRGKMCIDGSEINENHIIRNPGSNGVQIRLEGNTSDNDGHRTLRLIDGEFDLVNHAYTAQIFKVTKAGEFSTNTLFPQSDNTHSCGTAAQRWSVVYAGSGTISTSDARDKTPVRSLTTAEINAAKQLSKEIGAYKFLASVAEKGDAAREHIGMTVQRAIEILEANGLDPLNYGFICHDVWGDEFKDWPAREGVEYEAAWTETVEHEAQLGPDGEVTREAWIETIEHREIPAVEAKEAWTQQTRVAGDKYSFRTDELLMFIARGFEARLAALETA